VPTQISSPSYQRDVRRSRRIKGGAGVRLLPFRPTGQTSMKRRLFLKFATATIFAPAVSRLSWAQTYPVRPVRIVVGFPAGGAADIVARLIAQWLSERLAQQFIVENRTGATTNIATEAVINSTPDGYTLLLATSANSINATLYQNLNFNFVRDLAPIAGTLDAPLVMVVNPSFPAQTVPEFIAYAKANPGKINMASSGSGAPTHVAGELFKMMAGINLIHVPYRGDSPAITDLLGQQVQVYFGTLAGSIEYIRAGKLRPLALTIATRSDLLPDTPTVGDFLPGFEASSWHGLCAPKNTPAEIIEKLNHEINTGLADPKLKARFGELGLRPLPGSTADFTKLINDDTRKWAQVVRFAGLKAD
jgi:tripartite-type tricarboxylate transporter receptor subunit TctC